MSIYKCVIFISLNMVNSRQDKIRRIQYFYVVRKCNKYVYAWFRKL